MRQRDDGCGASTCAPDPTPPLVVLALSLGSAGSLHSAGRAGSVQRVASLNSDGGSSIASTGSGHISTEEKPSQASSLDSLSVTESLQRLPTLLAVGRDLRSRLQNEAAWPSDFVEKSFSRISESAASWLEEHVSGSVASESAASWLGKHMNSAVPSCRPQAFGFGCLDVDEEGCGVDQRVVVVEAVRM